VQERQVQEQQAARQEIEAELAEALAGRRQAEEMWADKCAWPRAPAATRTYVLSLVLNTGAPGIVATTEVRRLKLQRVQTQHAPFDFGVEGAKIEYNV
jgi:hypothetical protein